MGIDIFKNKCMMNAETVLGLQIGVEKEILNTWKVEDKEFYQLKKITDILINIPEDMKKELLPFEGKEFSIFDDISDNIGGIIYQYRSKLYVVLPEIISFYILNYDSTSTNNSEKDTYTSDTMPLVCCKSFTFYPDSIHNVGHGYFVQMNSTGKFNIYEGKNEKEMELIRENVTKENIIKMYYEKAIRENQKLKKKIFKEFDKTEKIRGFIEILISEIKEKGIFTLEMEEIIQEIITKIQGFDKEIKNVILKCEKCDFTDSNISCGWNQMCTEPRRIINRIININNYLEDKYNNLKQIFNYENSYRGKITKGVKKYLNPQTMYTNLKSALISLKNTIIEYKWYILGGLLITGIIASVSIYAPVVFASMTSFLSSLSTQLYEILRQTVCNILVNPILIFGIVFAMFHIASTHKEVGKETQVAYESMINLLTKHQHSQLSSSSSINNKSEITEGRQQLGGVDPATIFAGTKVTTESIGIMSRFYGHLPPKGQLLVQTIYGGIAMLIGMLIKPVISLLCTVGIATSDLLVSLSNNLGNIVLEIQKWGLLGGNIIETTTVTVSQTLRSAFTLETWQNICSSIYNHFYPSEPTNYEIFMNQITQLYNGSSEAFSWLISLILENRIISGMIITIMGHFKMVFSEAEKIEIPDYNINLYQDEEKIEDINVEEIVTYVNEQSIQQGYKNIGGNKKTRNRLRKNKKSKKLS